MVTNSGGIVLREGLKKTKTIAGFICNMLYIALFLFTLLVVFGAFMGTVKKTQPSVFGYSVSKIETPSMTADGLTVGSYVLSKRVNKASEVVVGDPASGKRGDIITFYAHASSDTHTKPILAGEDRSDMIIVIHEVIGVDGDGRYITKGSSNAEADKYSVPLESISGKYIETSAFMKVIINLVLVENRFLYWVVAVLLLVALKQVFNFFGAMKDYGIQREVLKGKRNLLDKACFERNVFKDFSAAEKKKLMANAPKGLARLYEYLFYGKLDGIEQLKDKRCGVADALYLTYAKESGSPIDEGDYIKSLPARKKNFDKYHSAAEFSRESQKEKLSAMSLLSGCVLFFVVYILITLLSGYYHSVLWYEVLVIVLIPLVTFLYFLLVIFENKATSRKIESYLQIGKALPERYHFVLRPEDFTSTQIDQSLSEIISKHADA